MFIVSVALAGLTTTQRSGMPLYVQTGEQFLPPADDGSRESGIGIGRSFPSPQPLVPSPFSIDSFPSPGTQPFGLAYDGANLWHVDLNAQTVYALDPVTGSVRRSFGAPDQWSKGLCFDGQYLWLTGNYASRIFKVDTTSGSVVLNFTAPGSNPAGLAWDGTYLWCADINSDQSKPSHIFKLLPSGGVVDSFDAPCRMVADMEWDGVYLWVNAMDYGLAYALDPADGSIKKVIGTPGPQPTGLAFVSNRIAISDWQTCRIYMFHPDSGPAAANIDFPAAYEVIPTWREATIIGTVSGLGLDSFRLESGEGANPTQWNAVGPSGTSPRYKDTLAVWDVSGITDAGEYSLRIKAFFGAQVDTHAVNLIGVDPQIASGWPYTHANISPVACADIAGSDSFEVLAGLDHQDFFINKLGGWRIDGSTLPGFPVSGIGVSHQRPATGDVDADGMSEVATGFDYNRENVYLVEGSGAVMSGWPRSGGHPGSLLYMGAPALGDVNGDSMLEVFSGGGYLSGWDKSGAALAGWPKSTEYSSPAIADFGYDGVPEFISLRKDSLYAYRADGSVMAGFPKGYGGTGGNVFPVAGDINGDNRLEIAFTIGAKLYLVNDSGRTLAGFPKTLSGSYANSPILGDIDNDGTAEIVVVSGTFPTNAVVQVFNLDGSAVTGWPKTLNGLVSRDFNAPVMGDIDNDTYQELLIGFENTVDGFEYFYAWNHDGTVLEGWPKLLRDVNGYGITGSPVLGDFDDDDSLDCALSSNAYWMTTSDIYVWNLGVPYATERMEWPMFRHDPTMTACYKSAVSGVEESHKPQATSYKPVATIVRGVLVLPRDMGENGDCPASNSMRCSEGLSPVFARPALLDLTGRKALDLHPGMNDVSRLVPGVYFVRAAGDRPFRVVLAR